VDAAEYPRQRNTVPLALFLSLAFTVSLALNLAMSCTVSDTKKAASIPDSFSVYLKPSDYL
jgi:hypothetical protein